ncbi:MAG: response regulator [Rhodobacteraceae bacterium]|nr:response regulator [Paracoccaceae bacterium]
MSDAGAPSAFRSRLSSLRHDMRSPIGQIIGYAELIEEEQEPETVKLVGPDLQAIHTAGQKMLALIDQHLGEGRASADEIDFTEVKFQLRLQLNHIAGYTEIMREDALEQENADLARDLDHIGQAQRTVIEMIEAMERMLTDPTAEETAKSEHDAPAATLPETIGSDVGAGGEILVVDDDPSNRELLTRRLARSGYSSTAVSTGDEALELLVSRRFDLILLDQNMPGRSGLETLQEIKVDARLRTIPVLMLSATDDTALMVQCILNGAEDYVTKPFNPVLLTARINTCLEKGRLRRNAARQIKVFISSPGDVIPERQILKRVLSRLNEEFAGRALLVPILWEEEPLLASDTFQAQIHPPRETQIYVGILWSRIGSPLPASITRPDGSIYDSGTAFEFEDALAGFRKSGHPEMLLYRKTGAPVISLEDKPTVLERIEQIDRLQDYVNRFLMGEDGSYVAAFHNFASEEDFETMSEMHLRKLVSRMVETG